MRETTTELTLRGISSVLSIPVIDIDLQSSFIQLGGHSLSAINLVSACISHGIQLDIKTILTSPTISALLECANGILPLSTIKSDVSCEPIHHLRANEAICLKPALLSPKTSDATTLEYAYARREILQLATTDRRQGYPMTEMQLCLTHGSRKHLGRNIIRYYETYRPKIVPGLKQAWKSVIQSEPIFRTTFDLDSNKGLLFEQESASFHWTEVIVPDQESFVAQMYLDDGPTGDIGTWFRVVTLPSTTSSDGKSTVIWSAHHALIDGYSSILCLMRVHRHLAGLPTLPGPSFARFAGDLHDFQERSREAGRSFWKQQNQLYPSPVSELLLSPSTKKMSSMLEDMQSVTLQVPIEEISTFARLSGVTLPSIFYAAWALTLSKYLDSDCICFGTVLSGRHLPLAGIESIVGPTVNTLPLYLRVNGGSTILRFVQDVFSRVMELTSFQWTLPEHGFSRSFFTALSVQIDLPLNDTHATASLEKPFSRINSDIPLNVVVDADGSIQINYNIALYNLSDILNLGEAFKNALSTLPVSRGFVDDYLRSILPNSAMTCLIRNGNCVSSSTKAGSVNDDLCSLFERVVTKYPHEAAVEEGGYRWTYSELGQISNLIALRLSSLVVPGEVVCVHADRSMNWIATIYGILIAGGVYCPLDEALPQRLRDANFVLADSKIFLTGSNDNKVLKPASCSVCLSVEEIRLNSREVSLNLFAFRHSASRVPQPERGAYLCFTSGSTGFPKAVLCSHKGLVAFQNDFTVRLCAKPGWKIAQVMSPAFDGSIHEIFSALSYGATLVLEDSENPFGNLRLVDAAILTPSIAKALEPSNYPGLSTVYLVGETVPQDVCNRWAFKKILYNMYGPTETTCGATIKRLLSEQPVTLGRPNPSTRIYVLDRNKMLVPQGVGGEIYLAGVQVSLGYAGQPEETDKSFLTDFIQPGPGEMMYRTGDRGYWDEHGELCFLGRNDRQIKLRGFRLDLDDLEIRMRQAVPECTTIAVTRKDDHLVAAVKLDNLDAVKFKSRISRILPPFALPRDVIAVDELPMTRAGKLDYKAIANSSVSTNSCVEEFGRGSLEDVLSSAWREILKLPQAASIQSDSNFLELGGNSILQLLLSSRLTKITRRSVSIKLILASSTLIDLAEAIRSLPPTGVSNQSEIILNDDRLSGIESEWQKRYDLDKGTSTFNVSFACRLDNTVELSRLAASWNVVLARHRILSCRYMTHRQKGTRRVFFAHPPRVEQVSQFDIWQESHRPFNLSTQNLARVLIAPNQMLVVISHIISDLTTLKILLREASLIYQDKPLPPIRRTYMETLHNTSQPALDDLEFWKSYLYRAPENRYSLSRTTDRTSYSGCSHVCKIPSSLFSHMIDFTSSHRVTLHQLALAAVALAIQPNNDYHDIVLGAPHLNRKSEDDLETVGLFLEPLPIRIRYPLQPSKNQSTDPSPSIQTSNFQSEQQHQSFIDSVRHCSQSALSHALPWDSLLTHLGVIPKFPTQPLFDIMVTFHDERHRQDEPAIILPCMQPLYLWTLGAKFHLMAEFMAVSEETLMLRLEYSDEGWDKCEVKLVERCIVCAMEGIVQERGYEDVKREVRRLIKSGVGGEGDKDGGEGLWGKRLDEL